MVVGYDGIPNKVRTTRQEPMTEDSLHIAVDSSDFRCGWPRSLLKTLRRWGGRGRWNHRHRTSTTSSYSCICVIRVNCIVRRAALLRNSRRMHGRARNRSWGTSHVILVCPLNQMAFDGKMAAPEARRRLGNEMRGRTWIWMVS